MSIFSDIMHKIFHHPAAAAPAHAAVGPAPAPAQAQPAPAAPAAAASGGAARAAPAQVDVGQVLQTMASQKGGGGNWQTSIVDLLNLLDMDSSLDARKRLADELGVHAGAPGSAEGNIALQRAVMRKLAENGGKVPEAMKA